MPYIRDHLAGARAAVEMLEHLSQEAGEPAVRELAGSLLVEVEADRGVLQQLAEELGGGASPVKEVAAWFGEKLSRLKLGGATNGRAGLPLFEALEALGLGIQGKLALWQALGVAAERDDRLTNLDYDALARRALDQHGRVEACRIELARRVLAKPLPSQ